MSRFGVELRLTGYEVGDCPRCRSAPRPNLSASGAGLPATTRTHGDILGSVGWLSQRHAQANGAVSENNWLNDIGYVSAAGGWYVTDHVRTELEIFTTSHGRQYRYSDARLEFRGRLEDVLFRGGFGVEF